MTGSSAQANPEAELAASVASSGAVSAMLVDRKGVALATAGDTSSFDVSSLATLVAGMFSATTDVARSVGEERFSVVLQQGDRRHLHTSLVRDDELLVILFEDGKRTGQVRHEARKCAERLAGAESEPSKPDAVAASMSTPRFKDYALQLIDRIFAPEA